MNGGLVIWLFIAHLVADFVIQDQNLLDERLSTELKTLLLGNLKHVAIYLILSLIVLIYYLFSPLVLVPAGLLFVSHLALDITKSFFIKWRPSMKYSIALFLADQLIHGIIIFITAYYVSQRLFFPGFVTAINNMVNDLINSFIVTANQKILLTIMLLIVGLWGVGVFINLFVNRMKISPYKRALDLNMIILNHDNGNGVPKGGFLIGVLERLIIIFAVVFNIINVIGFLITAKSIARFKKFDDDKFVEYFIIGSSISLISAVLVGIMIRQLNVFPLLKQN